MPLLRIDCNRHGIETGHVCHALAHKALGAVKEGIYRWLRQQCVSIMTMPNALLPQDSPYRIN